MAREPRRTSRRGIDGSLVATGRGDDGTTGLFLGGERVQKDDDRVEAYGTIDEAVAALGLARALLGGDAALATTLLDLQRELFVCGAELAANPDAWGRLQ